MAWNDGITGAHLNIAGSQKKTIGALAGPGTGKTTYGLLRRIQRLLEEKIDPKTILFLTFSRTAASDFVSKLEGMGVEGSGLIQARTLHSFCLELLGREDVLEKTGRIASRILFPFEEEAMLRDLPDGFGDLHNRRRLLKGYKSGWAEKPEDYPSQPKNDEQKGFETEILEWLKYHHSMLIDEVVKLAYDFLAVNPYHDVCSKYQHIIVDEFQDLNVIEQKLLGLLSREDCSLCIAGDDDQSIYGFRNAHPEGILDFVRDAEEKVYINICGRCPKEILDVANKIMAPVPGRGKEPMDCRDPEAKGEVLSVQWRDELDEKDGLTTAIALDVQQGRRPGDILVLIQSKELGQAIRRGLEAATIPAKSYYNEDPIEGPIAKRAFTLFALLADPTDMVAFRYWFGHGDPKLASRQYKIVLEQAKVQGVSPQEFVEKNEAFMKKSLSKVKLRIDTLTQVKAKTTTLSLDEIIELVFPAGVEELRPLHEIAQLKKLTCETVVELYKEMVGSVIGNTGIEVEQQADFVRVMSLHKSKGLTSPLVYIAALVDGLIPRHPDSEDEQASKRAHDESRRLLYVGVTRAQEKLILSSFSMMPAYLAHRNGIKPGGNAGNRNGEQLSKVQTSSFLIDLSSVLPSKLRGDDWLDQRAKQAPSL